jgi:hypothetical protein
VPPHSSQTEIQDAAVPSHDQHASEQSAAPHSGQTANKTDLAHLSSPIPMSSTQLHMRSSYVVGSGVPDYLRRSPRVPG